jgi:hypothetical protein
MNFLERAQYTASKGVPVIRLRPNSKAPMDVGWPEFATTNIKTLERWNQEFPDANCGAVAQAKIGGYLFLELDSVAAFERIEKETGHKFPETYLVRSRVGRGHFYFAQTQKSIEAGNISQSYVKEGDWSLRSSNAYVVAAHSLHPHSPDPYTPLNTNPILPIPDWLVDWCISQKIEKAPAPGGDVQRNEKGLVAHGWIHGWLVTTAGRLRNLGLDIPTLETALVELAQKNCAPPLDLNKVRQVARSFEKYTPGGIIDIIFNQQPVVPPAPNPEDVPTFEPEPYPVFPAYVMTGTSIKKNFVDPICAHNSRIDYFMWLPAMAMLLNYVGVKIKLKSAFDSRPIKGSIFMALIGKRGETIKSTSALDAMNYFHYAGLLAHHNRDTKNAEGKTLVWTAGSPEGLGLEMQKSNCKNALLFYDELEHLVRKAGIDGSSMRANLLTLYEAGKFSNSVRATKEVYSLDPDSYCASLITCCTDARFNELWSRMAGQDTGLNDRFFFVYQPEELPVKRMKVDINTLIGSQETRRMIDKALAQGEFEFEDINHPDLQELVAMGNRYVDRASKWAIALAIDLGLNKIDDECVVRACAIVKYEIAVKRYLKNYEAVTREGELQQRIRHKLEMAGGSMETRALLRVCHAERHGTSDWDRAYKGLLGHGIIAEVGAGSRGEPKTTKVLIKRDIDEEDL